jgi:hypothetical protein
MELKDTGALNVKPKVLEIPIDFVIMDLEKNVVGLAILVVILTVTKNYVNILSATPIV